MYTKKWHMTVGKGMYEQTPNMDDQQNRPRRKILEGSASKHKQQRLKSKNTKSRIQCDVLDYEADLHHDVYEDLLVDWATDTDCDHQYATRYDPASCSSADPESSSRHLQGCSLDSSFDSGFSDTLTDNTSDSTCVCPTSPYTAFIDALIQFDLPELFINAELTSSVSNVGPGINKFAHSGGDVHTVCSALIGWLEEKKSNTKLPLKRWARRNRVNPKAVRELSRVLTKINVTPKSDSSGLTDAICDLIPNELCFYLGHPDIGYRSLSTGEVIPCCSSSVLRFLDEMPRYTICLPRHAHADNTDCYLLTTINDSKARAIAKVKFPTFDEDEYSSLMAKEMSAYISLGPSRCALFSSLWREQAASLNMTTVHVDARDNTRIKFFAPDYIQDDVAKLTARVLHQTQSADLPETSEQCYPLRKSVMKLHISNGAACDKVVIETNSRFGEPLSEIVTNVVLNIDIDTSPWFAKELDATCIREYCRQDIHNILKDQTVAQWTVTRIIADTMNPRAHVTLQFKDNLVAQRAVELLDNQARVTVANRLEVERQLTECTVRMHEKAFAVLRYDLISLLDHFQRSPRYRVSYTFLARKDLYEAVLVSSQNQRTLRIVIEDLKALVLPRITEHRLAWQSTADKHSFSRANHTQVLDMISKVTNTHLEVTRANRVSIYGERNAKSSATNLMSHVLGPHQELWNNIGRLTIKDTGSVPELNILLNQQEVMFDKTKDPPPAMFHINLETKELWLLPYHLPNIDQLPQLSPDDFKNWIQSMARKELGAELPLENIAFEQVASSGISECGVCYSDISHGRSPYVMEVCEHIYCMDCLVTQLRTLARDKRLPITCAVCDEPWSIPDFNNIQIMTGAGMLTRILAAALADFISKNQDLYGFCPKPNCKGIFQKCARQDGGLVCAVCTTGMCLECFERAHDGYSCEHYQEVGKWLAEDPDNRKKCPKCNMGIEKNEGCNHVLCAICRKAVCWKCLAYFDSSEECYSHIRKQRHW